MEMNRMRRPKATSNSSHFIHPITDTGSDLEKLRAAQTAGAEETVQGSSSLRVRGGAEQGILLEGLEGQPAEELGDTAALQ